MPSIASSKVTMTTILLQRKEGPSKRDIEKRKEPTAFYNRFQPSAGPGKNLWYCTAGKVVRDKKLKEYENENYYFLWRSDKRHFPYNCLGLTDEDNSVSRTDNFVNVNVFNTVASARVLSYYCWVLHYFSTIPVGGIKIVTFYKRSFSKLSGSQPLWFFVFRRTYSIEAKICEILRIFSE